MAFTFLCKNKDGSIYSCYTGVGSKWSSDLTKVIKFTSAKEALAVMVDSFHSSRARNTSGSFDWNVKEVLKWMIKYDVDLEFRK